MGQSDVLTATEKLAFEYLSYAIDPEEIGAKTTLLTSAVTKQKNPQAEGNENLGMRKQSSRKSPRKRADSAGAKALSPLEKKIEEKLVIEFVDYLEELGTDMDRDDDLEEAQPSTNARNQDQISNFLLDDDEEGNNITVSCCPGIHQFFRHA